VPYRRKKLTFAISSPDEFLYENLQDYFACIRNVSDSVQLC